VGLRLELGTWSTQRGIGSGDHRDDPGPDAWLGLASDNSAAVADSGSPAPGTKLAAAETASDALEGAQSSSDAASKPAAPQVLFGARPNYAFAVSDLGGRNSNPELIAFGADGTSSNRTCAFVRS
jgi:hypothetical protein